MKRPPDRTEQVKIGAKLEATVETWLETADNPWDGDHELPEGSEGYDILVRATLDALGGAYVGTDSLGGTWITPDKDGRAYLESECEVMKENALDALRDDIDRVASGKELHDARMRQNVAKAITKKLF